MIKIIIAWIAGIALFLVAAAYIVDLIMKAPGYKGPKTAHFNGKKFHNLSRIKGRGLWDVIKWSVTGDPGEWTDLSDSLETPSRHFPEETEDGTLSITFVNHSTFLIQVDGLNILTDPIWSDRASPFQWIGPKRMRPPGIRFEDLPHIDLVLISHNHYDHLDIATVENLNARFEPLFITPLGVSNYLKQKGIKRTAELDWWQDYAMENGSVISAVPAQHFSGRGLSDRDKTLWAGYVLQSPSGTVYFAGDTGDDGFFDEIGSRFAPIDVALIPVGAYRPRWFMAPIHVDPEEAVLIHKEVKAKLSIGMHFGTFPMADDGMKEPVQDLAKAREKHGISPAEFFVLEEGKTFSCQPHRQQLQMTGE